MPGETHKAVLFGSVLSAVTFRMNLTFCPANGLRSTLISVYFWS